MKIKMNILIFPFILFSYITNQMQTYLLFLLLVILHELGHMIIGTALGLKLNEVEIMPFGCSIRFKEPSTYVEGRKKGNRKKIWVALAGPMMNIILIFVFLLMPIQQELYIYANIAIAMFNLLPIYPLDGGRILEAILDMKLNYQKKNEYLKRVTEVTMIVLTSIASILLFYYENILIFLGILYMWRMLAKQKMIFS